MTRTVAKWLIILSYFVILILALIFAENEAVLIGITAVGIIIIWVLSHFLRCRNCGRSQGKSWISAEYCPYCGEPLEDE